MKKESNLRFLLNVSKKESLKLYIAATMSALSSIIAIAPYILMAGVFGELLKTNVNYQKVKEMAYMVTGFVVIRLILFIAAGIFSHIAAFTILYELRMKTIKHISKLNLGFFSENTIGKVKKIINEDIEKLENFIAHQIPDLASAVISPLVIIGYLFYLEWKMAIVLFIPIIIGMLLQLRMFKKASENMKSYQKVSRKLNSTILEYIHGIKVMKAFNISAKSFKKYKDTTKEYADLWESMSEASSKNYGIFLALIDSGLFFILPFGGYMFLTNQVSGPTYIIFIVLSTVFLNSFRMLVEFGMEFSMLLEGAAQVKKILNKKPQNNGKKYIDNLESKSIEFKNVSFKYDNKYVIKDLSLKIEANKTVALVGASGAGKTTIGRLVGRFWDVDKGEILIDGKNINDFKISNLMDQISFVFQDVFMLHDTIYENIIMGSNYTNDQVIAACKSAQIHEFIMKLPNQYETLLGENGIKLSGGQKQRISVARAILKNSPIVVLDEVTSYSDIENEGEIQRALKNLLKGKTAIIIAHRLYTIQNVDEIIVLDKGKIKENGTHKELLDKKGRYYDFWNQYNHEIIDVEKGV